jgi:hypothetical protein
MGTVGSTKRHIITVCTYNELVINGRSLLVEVHASPPPAKKNKDLGLAVVLKVTGALFYKARLNFRKAEEKSGQIS